MNNLSNLIFRLKFELLKHEKPSLYRVFVIILNELDTLIQKGFKKDTTLSKGSYEGSFNEAENLRHQKIFLEFWSSRIFYLKKVHF
jgi:hypothetical protein